jgi:integrase
MNNENMLSFQIKRFKKGVDDESESIILLDKNKKPVFWPNVFVTSQYYKRGASLSTCEKVLRAISIAMKWANSLDFNFDEEMVNGKFLSLDEIQNLADFLGFNIVVQDEVVNENKLISKFNKKVINIEDIRPKHAFTLKGNSIRSNVSDKATRIRYVALYIQWHLDKRVGKLVRDNKKSAELKQYGDIVISRLRDLTPRTSNQRDDDIHLEGVSREIQQRIEDIFQPNSVSAPFKSDFIQQRNYLMWRLFHDTGARRGEVHETKVNDIDYATKRYRIVVSKTIPRTNPISQITADAFDSFIELYWSRLPKNARKRGYLFTRKDGGHISKRTINRIFERIRNKSLEIPGFVSPHTSRRSWNDNFSELIDSLPVDEKPTEEKEKVIRNRLQGWTENSEMGARYAKRHIKIKADEIAEKLVNKLQEKDI